MNPRIPTTCPVGFQGRYTVVSGDTMFFIAQRFGVTLNALIAANPHITNPGLIFPGDVLCVPGVVGGREPVSCPVGFRGRYTVVSGDTMFLIAQRFGVTLNALIAANPHITDPNVIFPGDVLCVPGEVREPVSCPVGFESLYIVQPGDTMFSIAQMFGVSLAALIAANPQITDPAVLFPGDVLCVPGREPVSCPVGFMGRYTVQPGDTMFSIAQMFGVSLADLIAANPQITDPDVLFPGDVLCVPGEPRKPVTCPVGFEGRYTVQPGDTLFSIAQMFGVSLRELEEANPQITDPNILFPGDVLCVPTRVPVTCPVGFKERYTVQSGDTMFSIAKRFGVSLDALIAANPQIPDPDVLIPGDILCVP